MQTEAATTTATAHVHYPVGTPDETRHRDKYRGGERLRLRITARTGGHLVGAGFILRKGVNEVIVDAADMPIIDSQIENEPHKIEIAEQAFQAEVDRACAEHKGPRVGAELREYMLASINSSPGAHFRLLFNRDPNPFLKVERLETLPPERNWEDATADAMASRMGVGIAQAMAPLVESIKSLAESAKRGK